MTESAAPKIGLALSGGGSRAIAFHLGCLRALNRLGLLDRVAILSTVSGGSVIGAYFHAHFHAKVGDFASFETKIRALLAQGLAAPMCRKLFSVTGVKVAAAFTVVGLVALTVTLIKMLIKVARWVTPRGLAAHFERFEIRSPLHRFASRTTLLEAALDGLLFKGASLTDLPAQPHLVINATELRTGSAFRFGTMESGSWRWGKRDAGLHGPLDSQQPNRRPARVRSAQKGRHGTRRGSRRGLACPTEKSAARTTARFRGRSNPLVLSLLHPRRREQDQRP
jgi:NTE family protein